MNPIEQSWDDITAAAFSANESVRRFSTRMARRWLDDQKLVLESKLEFGAFILNYFDGTEKLERTAFELTGQQCRIKCEFLNSSTTLENFPEPPKISAPIQTPKIDPPKIESKTESKAEQKISTIDSLSDGQKKIVVEGFVGEEKFAPEVRNLKTGKQLLQFSISDSTNGISIKKFYKSGETIDLSELKSGSRVRVYGDVKFDDFAKENVIFATKFEKAVSIEREDLAAETRVELHAHTTMSAMDSVVRVEQLIKTAARWNHPAVAITDHGVIQAFPDAMKTARKLKKEGKSIKIIYGLEGYLGDLDQKFANHIIILARNQIGLQNLYKLISISHLRFFHKRPRIPKKILEEHREGLIIGSACEAGELIRAIVAEKSHEELKSIASFYDYLEIQPIHNNDFLKRSEEFPKIKTDEDLIAINLKVAELAKELDKPLVATCDVHFLNPEDQIYRAIIMKGQGFTDADNQPPIYFRTTSEMLNEFEYLGLIEAYEAVVTNPRKIAEMCEELQPIPDALYAPAMPGADEEIRDTSYNRAKELYGEDLPEIVLARLDQELKPIIHHGFSSLYIIAQRLVKKSNSDGYLVGSRGSVGSSFVATMLGITEVNPLPPHWRCPNCKHSEFVTDGSFGCGYDLPNKNCPNCGSKMEKDGHDIPFAVFLGFDGDKVPDIDLNFSGEYQSRAHKYTEVLFGKDNVYRAGSITTVAAKTSYGLVIKYYEEKKIPKHRAFIDFMSKRCMGVKKTTGQHPAGIMVVPRDMDIHFFSPLQHPADDKTSKTITTHFDYHSISERLVKLDILGHDDPTVIKMLEDLTHIDPKTIPFDDPETLSIFSSTKALGVTPEQIGTRSGTFGIPEFRTPFTRQMIDDTQPNCFSDLVRISGFSHGTDVWLNNAQDLIRSKICTLKDAISARDDIMMYLIHNGIEPLLAFKTMERVRKGKGIEPDVVEKLRVGKIPEWYIEACQKIKYLFPRAHATAYVMMAFRIAYCKVHHPLAYYAAYFSIRAETFDANLIVEGKDRIQKEIDEISRRIESKQTNPKDEDRLAVFQLALEMYLRGIKIERIDLYKSDAERFQIIERTNSLLPPFVALQGMGTVASRGIVKARSEREFTSIEDLKKRSGASSTMIEILKSHGTLEGLGMSDQINLF
ncbi:MAG: PolC-type DNA polymerase III [Selenomonadaceae bacterium]|nr:PolC-type DNA polymerase III [Selenomonadaceae bacterium]